MLLPDGGQLAALQPVLRQHVVRFVLKVKFVVLRRLFVVTVFALHLRQIKEYDTVGVVVTHGVLVRAHGAAGVVDAAVAVGGLVGPFAAFGPILGLGAHVGLAVFGARFEVFPDGVELIAFFHVTFRATACQP